MAPATLPQISNTYLDDNLEEFRRLLRANPEFLRTDEGMDRWMWCAAMDGKLSFIKALMGLGMDVNESNDSDEPEGPIQQASYAGHVEIVRWLLEHGARINHVVKGKPRCWPLVGAATNGHLDVVKLLVEHGADIHATWNGINAITQAEDFGQLAVRDYLRSLGARTLRETTAPDYPRSHKEFIKQMTGERGALGEWYIDIPGDPLVTIHVIPASQQCDVQTLFTIGLSDHRLPRVQQESACTELRCMLAPDWPLTEAALRDPISNWPVEWLKRLVQQLRLANRWPEEPATFMNGDPPMPLAPNTKLCGWLCLKSLGESVWAPDYRWIDIHSLFPIYVEELALIRQSGHEELVNRFQDRNVPLHIDPRRQNMVTNA